MSAYVIEQLISKDKAKVLEADAITALDEAEASNHKVTMACFKVRDTQAFKTLGHASFTDWGTAVLGLKKSRLYELTKAGNTRNNLHEEIANSGQPEKSNNSLVTPELSTGSEVAETKGIISKEYIDDLSIPHLTALAKAVKGNRLKTLTDAIEEVNKTGNTDNSTALKKAIEERVNVPKTEASKNNTAVLERQLKTINKTLESFERSDKRTCHSAYRKGLIDLLNHGKRMDLFTSPQSDAVNILIG